MTQSTISKPFSLRQLASQKGALALGVSAALLGTGAQAQEDEEYQLDKLQIEERTIDSNPYAEPGAPYKARLSGDARHVKPIADTPQTITVLTQTQIQDSGYTDLRDIVQAQPGITLGTGENGNAFGDRYIIRGHEARSDVFVDGLRDPGMTTRESFATDQIEITKGPSSTFAGRGSTGGAINSVTKQASTEYDFTKLQGGLGDADYRRLTLDSNQTLGDDMAVRINLLHSYNEVPERAPADKERNGLALSGSYQATPALSVVADYYYLEAKDAPDLGTYIEPNGGEPVDDIPVYVQDQDFLDSTVNTGTLRLNYDINDSARFSSSLRYGTTENGYVVTGARGTSRHDTDPQAPGAATISLSTHQGWQEVDYWVNQNNLYLDNELFGLAHQWLVSVEYSDMAVLNGVYNVTNTGASNCVVSGRGGAANGYCIIDADGNAVSDIGNLMGRDIVKGDFDSDYNIQTWSVALMDTVELADDWSAFAGVRADSFDYTNTVSSRGTVTDYAYDDTLFNYHLGVVHQLTEAGNIYLTYSTSSNINGGESDLGGNCGYGGICGTPEQVVLSEPEQTENWELGSKWNLLDEKLLATVALFQITKNDVMESVGDSYSSLGTLNTGKNRVKGIELGLSGNITENLSAQVGVSFMDAEVLDSFNPDNVGHTLSNFAEEQAFVQLRWQATDAFAVGGTVTYSSEMYAGQPDGAAGYSEDLGDYSYTVPSYTLLDLFAQYDVNEKLYLRLNLANATDTDYYLATYRSGAFTYIGDARNINLTVNFEF